MKLRVALVGAGGIGAHHAARYPDVKNVELTAVVDIDKERASSLAQKYGVTNVFASLDDALASDTFDAVDVCLPTWLHAQATVAAADAGKHVLCEKPMAISLEEAESMVQAAEKAGVVLMIAHCRRYDDYWGAVKKAIDDGAIGRPVVWRDVLGSQGPGPDWFYARDKGLGPLVDGAIHNYDFARVMFGEARWVFASTRNFKNVTAPDTGGALIRFEDDDELQLSWSWGLPSGTSAGRTMDIMGPEGVLYFSVPAKVEAPACPEGYGQIVVLRKDGEVVPYQYPKTDMYAGEIQAFVDGVAAGRNPDPDGREGKRSLAIGLAVIESGDSSVLVQPARE